MMKQNKGFTLTEMIISILLISILAFAVTYIFMEGFRSYIMNRNVIDLRSDARPALKRMVFEIREAESISVNSTEFTISADIDDNGVAEEIRYYVSGNGENELRREEDEDLDGTPDRDNVILGNIENVTFDPLPETGPPYNSIILDITISKMDDAVHIRTQVRGRNI